MEPVLALMEVHVKDKEKFAQYLKGHLPTIDQYGGKVVLRSEGIESIEGDWLPKLFVMQEWPSVDAFRKWYASKEYQPWKDLRKEACDLKLTLVRKL
ncbi:DUF1330 domain-containing protein [Geotalea toluenoxydans]|uniref:DUF1330 domain-containing protein n=1 Tax=Geotalea toluenoxydans TaxID=421624 RepID=UPI0006D21D42|nr:DUF1330 domain-containing protein [Geotalea toluenoxydans]